MHSLQISKHAIEVARASVEYSFVVLAVAVALFLSASLVYVCLIA